MWRRFRGASSIKGGVIRMKQGKWWVVGVVVLCLAAAFVAAASRRGGDDAARPPELPAAPAEAAPFNPPAPEASETTGDVHEEIIADFGDSDDPDEQHHVAQALAAKAEEQVSDEEKIRIYDEIARRFQNHGDSDLRVEAARALLAKARLMNTGRDGVAVLDRLVDAFRYEDNPAAGGVVLTALEERLPLVGDRSAHAAALRDIAEKNPNPRVAAMALSLLAGDLLESGDNRIKVYDEIIARFRGDDAQRALVDEAMFAKARLSRNREEKTGTLLEWARRASDADEARERRARAMMLRSRLAETDAEKLQIYEYIIEDGGGFESTRSVMNVLPALAAKAAMLGDASVVKDFFRPLLEGMPAGTRLWLLSLQAEAMPDAADKIAVYDEIFASFGKDPYSDVRRRAQKLYLSKVKLLDDPEQKSAVIDEVLRPLEEGGSADMDAFFLMQEKAGLLRDPAAKITLYDRMAALADTLAMPSLAATALIEKAGLLREPEERIRLYDLAAEKSDGNPHNLARALLGKADAAPGDAEKLALYDRIIDNPGNDPERVYPVDGRLLLQALLRKSTLTGRDYAREYLEKRLAGGVSVAAAEACLELAAMADDPDEKRRLYREVWLRYADNPFWVVQGYVAKAVDGFLDSSADPGEALRFCDEVIARYGDLGPDSEDVKAPLARAYYEKAARTDAVAEKAELYDRIVLLYDEFERSKSRTDWRGKALAAKAALAGAGD